MDSDNSDGTPDMTLSFLDVIANGFGSLLVLFFLTTVIHSGLAWPLTSATTPTTVASDQDPFVIMVTPSAPSGLLPSFPDPQGPWRIDDGEQQKAAAGMQAGWGRDHAILVLDRRPGPSAVVHLYLPAGSEKMDCQWFTATNAGRASITPGGAGPWVQVWPRPEGEK